MPANRTSCRQHLFTKEHLWESLVTFSQAEPASLLWHSNGRYESLVKFLAPRFLLAPDHVLDAERVHARWQWLCDKKKALKLMTLNASLRLQHYIENSQGLPSFEDLLPHLQAERANRRVPMEALMADEDVAVGWRY